MSSFSCVLIGNESLVIQCGEILLERGHAIKAVASSNSDVQAWAESQDLTAIDGGQNFSAALKNVSFEWLFSIANLSVLPDDVVAAASSGAINFHDGPLPQIAGLNAPVWSLLRNEPRHGISWHMMDGGVDEGDILEQVMFDVSTTDTALTLNTKCFEAAIQSFGPLVSQLESEELNRTKQDLSLRTVYARADRPAAAARLDMNQPVAEIERLVRALDHGAYWNPLSIPKIEINDHVILVRGAEQVEQSTTQKPGYISGVSDDRIEVATSDGVMALSRLTDATGAAVAIGDIVTVGDAVLSLDSNDATALTEKMSDAARSDGFWRNRLENLTPPAQMDLGGNGEQVGIGSLPMNFGTAMTAPSIIGVVGCYAARSSGTDRVDLSFQNEKIGDAGLAGYISDWAPVSVDASKRVADSTESVCAELSKLENRSAFALDLLARSTDLAGFQTPGIGVKLSDTDGLVADTAMTIQATPDGQNVRLVFDKSRVSDAVATTVAARLEHLALQFQDDQQAVADLSAMPETERTKVLYTWNDTDKSYDNQCVHKLIEDQAAKTPDAPAAAFEDVVMTYAELNSQANRVAHVLTASGVGPKSLVGLHVRRSLDLLIGALAIQKSGGAYVPLDPDYPENRIEHYISDCELSFVISQTAIAGDLPKNSATVLMIDQDPRIGDASDANPTVDVSSADLAYMIYTSGSTGAPKGVMVEHRNVANFFAAMDDRVPSDQPGSWMAVTSLSFDISVLELFYTMARGFKVVISGDDNRSSISAGNVAVSDKKLDFSLFYWGNDDGIGPKKYRLLLEGAKIADQNGFCAVWTPERHFHAFGGPYPNPSVTGAAVAAVTNNLAVRAGSCVAPLHHPARIAEDWAVIDNLTNGRTGLGIASGWQPHDFVLRPENTPPNNKPAMYDAIEKLRKLWRGEEVEFPMADGTNHAVVTQPRPVSKELQIWVTTAGNPDTWREAGEIGANVLTHLLGQSVDEVGDKIKLYHKALRDSGRDPADHKVTLMLHSYVADDREKAREIAREPMIDYLRSAAGLIKQFAWAFPAFKKPKGVENPMQLDLGTLEPEELDAILEFAFLRYFEDSGLFGTVEDCLERAEQLKKIGVNEIACLIDYGIETDLVLESLHSLSEVLRRTNAGAEVAVDDFSIAAQVVRHGVTHMQCTPSMARLLTADDAARSALGQIKHLFIGGEALPGNLVTDLQKTTNATIENMYGPTETTIWSSTGTANDKEPIVGIGNPIANNRLYVLDDNLEPQPIGVAGELFIGGHGVTRGYWNRKEQTADRFIPDPFDRGTNTAPAGARLYRTGDIASWRADGSIAFHGRADHQVKLRGYRIELGEIESKLEDIPAVEQAVVVAREENAGDVRLVAYVKSSTTVSDSQMKEHLATLVPDYMVPAHFVGMDSFPLTPNKKVDRNALPDPAVAASSRRQESFAAPENSVEREIATIWTNILGVSPIGSKDNFFDLGGHSLLAVQAHREIRKSLNATKLSITDIFRFPTLAGLAAQLGSAPEKSAKEVSEEKAAVAEKAKARTDAMSRRRAMRANRNP